MRFAELMFYAEAEGLLPTRAGKINAVIRDIKDFPSPTIDFMQFKTILSRYDLNYDDLTDLEKRYINAKIS